MSTKQFANPSAVVSTSAAFYEVQGGKSGDDGCHQLQIFTAPPPMGSTAPTFTRRAWTEVVDGTPGQVHDDGTVTTKAFNRTSPYLLAVDDATVVLIYGGGEVDPKTRRKVGGVYTQVFAVADGSGTVYRVADPTRIPGIDYGLDANNSHAYMPSIGVAQFPGEPVFVIGYADQHNQLNLVTGTVSSAGSPLDTRTVSTSTLLPAAQVDPAWTGDLSLALVVNPFVKQGDPPFALLWTMRFRDAERGEWAQVWMAKVGLGQDGVVTITSRGLLASTFGHVPTLNVHRAIDGVPYLFWTRPRDGRYCVGPITTSFDNTPNPFGDSSVPLTYPKDKTITGVDRVPPVFYAFEPLPSDTEAGTTANTTITRWVQFAESSYVSTAFGSATRESTSIPPQQAGQLGQLLGWIEGGPPVPSVNIQARNLADNDTFGMVVFGSKEEKSTDWKLTSTVGTAFTAHAEVGIPLVATVSMSLELSLGITAGLSRKTQTETVQHIYCETKGAPGAGGGKEIAREGTALLLYPGFVADKFTFYLAGGQKNPLAPDVVQLYSAGSVMEALTFEIPANRPGGIVPGDLATYLLDPGTKNALEGNAIAMNVGGDPHGWITTSVTSSGGTQEEIAATLTGGASLGAYFDLKSTVGADGIFGEDSATVERSLKIDFDYSWESSEREQLSCDMDTDHVSAKDKNEGAFSSWTFDTILVKHDPVHTIELLGLLQAYPTPDNTALLSRILPQSIPWKITYALDDAIPTVTRP
ncbi:MAG TPA: hypothetical protein VIT41_09655 [Microlunatus sp.]